MVLYPKAGVVRRARPLDGMEGPLLPPGWRPDREERRDDSDDHHWVVVDPAGRLRLADGTGVALRPLRPGDGNLLAPVSTGCQPGAATAASSPPFRT